MSNINEFNQPIGRPIPNWSGAKRPDFRVHNGRLCIVEPFEITKHAHNLFHNLSCNNKGDSWTYLPYGPFYNLKDFISWLTATISKQDVQLYAISNRSSEVIGIAGYLRIDPEHGSIEIGHIHYSKILQKNSTATEAMYLMMSHVFEDLGYRRYEWKCNSLNEPSRKAALRLGFKFEGIFRQNYIFKGCNRDTAWFSIIDSEWPELKRKFMKWLEEENFDENGHQRIRLGEIQISL